MWCGTTTSSPCSHSEPVYPVAHAQVKEATPSTHEPPFWQLDEPQSSMSVGEERAEWQGVIELAESPLTFSHLHRAVICTYSSRRVRRKSQWRMSKKSHQRGRCTWRHSCKGSSRTRQSLLVGTRQGHMSIKNATRTSHGEPPQTLQAPLQSRTCVALCASPA